MLDPFGGSGTTAVVARELGRKSLTIELSPTSFNSIVERLKIGTINVQR